MQTRTPSSAAENTDAIAVKLVKVEARCSPHRIAEETANERLQSIEETVKSDFGTALQFA